MLHWLNQNSGAINAILTLLLAIATAIYVYLTRRLLAESIAVRRAAMQPIIAITTSVHRLHMNLLNLVIENAGGGPAYNVRFTISQPTLGQGISDLSKIGFMARGLKYFGAGQRLEFFLANSIGNLELLRNSPLVIGVTYDGVAHADLTETFTIDFSELENMSRVNDIPESEISDTLKKLESSVSSLANGWHKLPVRLYSLEDEAREGRVHELYMQLNRLPAPDFSEVEAIIKSRYEAASRALGA